MRFPFFKRKQKKPKFTVAFYNLENLFDAEDDAHTLDDDFTPNGFKRWTTERYQKKLGQLARTLVRIGADGHGHIPVMVGVAEVENHKVLKDLLATPPLDQTDYQYVHYESPDERGIDTGLIFRSRFFQLLHSEPLPLMVENNNGERDTTRDILYVKGKLNGELIHLFVNHWPSRRQGSEETEHKRIAAAEVVKDKIKGIEAQWPHANIIVMGDFNDDPNSKSIQTLLAGTSLFNPMEKLHRPKKKGSSHYKKQWNLFDQLLLSHSFFNYEKGTHSFDSAHIFDDASLMERKGKYKGSPYRTYVGKKYLGGYSDHFPVYLVLGFNP
ncbi:endonuclease [Maribacter sp. 2307ULW6-5]|uniref:endonuclease/exonuclease/phosphatase family protein n=1 Tax=Maribacter sp. 2307ULW6-5 TaxID=3386275 RepID=UPI0039BCC5E0